MTTTQDRIDGLIGDLGIKAPVLVATTAAITLYGEQTIDGVAVVAEDRVLVKDQADAAGNGIYCCQATIWLRAPDFDGARDVVQGTVVQVAQGTVNSGTQWRLTTADPVIGTSDLDFSSSLRINQEATGYHFAQHPAIINRMGDRLFVGDATKNDGAFPNVEKDWLIDYQNTLLAKDVLTPLSGLGVSSVLYSTNNNISGSACAGLFGSHSKYFSSAGASCIAVSGIAVNDNATLGTSAWGGYFEAHRELSTSTGTYGIEIDARTKYADNQPHSFQQALVVDLQLAAGAGLDVSGQRNVGAAIQICRNPTAFRAGIVFGSDSIEGTIGKTGTLGTAASGATTNGSPIITFTAGNEKPIIGVSVTGTNIPAGATISTIQSATQATLSANATGTATGLTFSIDFSTAGRAISMAPYHSIEWHNSAGSLVSRIITTNVDSAAVMEARFAALGFTILDGSSVALRVSHIASSVNGIQVLPAITGSSPQLTAIGDDTNLDLVLQGKGTGVIRFGTWAANADAAVNGYVTIRDIGGTLRKLATIA